MAASVLTYLALAIVGLFFLPPLYTSMLPQERAKSKLWSKINVVGLPSGRLPWARALIGSFTQMVQTSQEGYVKYCKKGLSFALPTMWTGDAVVVLPPSQLDLLNKDSQLSAAWAIFDNNQMTWHIDHEVLAKLIHFEVSRRDLTQKHVGQQAEPTADEAAVAFREIWGTNTKEWQTVNSWDTMGRVMTRVALRTIVGSPMCSNEELLEQSRLFGNSIFGSSVFINGVPPSMRPVLGRLLSLQTGYHKRRCLKIIVPLVKERLCLWEESKVSPDIEMPNDFLQWLIGRCAGHGEEHLAPRKIAMRLLTLNTMFVFGMSYVFTHTLLDILASPDKDEFLPAIEEECRRVAAQYQAGLASKDAIDRLYRVDSAIRESMRISDVSVVGLFRDVVGDQVGVGNGVTAPVGTRVVYPTQAIHTDPDFWEDPHRFDAFRFSRPHEPDQGAGEGKGEGERNKKGEAVGGRELLTTLTPSFLSFGYGKRACTGRWFVSQTIKQTIAYLVMNYDVEIEGEPPKRRALMNMMLPPDAVKLRVRRKAKSSS